MWEETEITKPNSLHVLDVPLLLNSMKWIWNVFMLSSKLLCLVQISVWQIPLHTLANKLADTECHKRKGDDESRRYKKHEEKIKRLQEKLEKQVVVN